jgi:hypothetical protein
MAADGVGNPPERDTVFGDSVKRTTFRAMLKREPKNPRRIEPMHRRPEVLAITHIGGQALLPRQCDQLRDKAVGFARAVNHPRQPNGGRAHPTLGQSDGSLL